MLRVARRQGRTAGVSQKFEERMKELGYSFDPWKRKWIRGEVFHRKEVRGETE